MLCCSNSVLSLSDSGNLVHERSMSNKVDFRRIKIDACVPGWPWDVEVFFTLLSCKTKSSSEIYIRHDSNFMVKTSHCVPYLSDFVINQEVFL